MAIITKAVINEQSMEEAISAISGVRVLEFSQMLRRYNQMGWYQGDFQAWMSKCIEAAQSIWKATGSMREKGSAIEPDAAKRRYDAMSRPRNQPRSARGAPYDEGRHSRKHKSSKHRRHRRG